MGENSLISWTDHTFNPWMGCTKVSPACQFCYAERDMDTRLNRVAWGPSGSRVVTAESNWRKPLKWNKDAKSKGVRYRVFCASLADVFEDWQGTMIDSKGGSIRKRFDGSWITDGTGGICRNDFPVTMQDVRNRLFALIDATPNLDWLLLTKRPENIQRMTPCRRSIGEECYVCRRGRLECKRRENIWLGTSVENQEQAVKRIKHLISCHQLSPVRFLSCEPLLGPIDLEDIWVPYGEQGDHDQGFSVLKCLSGFRAHKCGGWTSDHNKVQWVITGGESGPEARLMHLDWVRGLRDQCVAAGVPFHFKQHGEWVPASQVPGGVSMNYMTLKKTSAIDRSGRVYGPTDPLPKDVGVEIVHRIGKKEAGRLLDGREWSEFPNIELDKQAEIAMDERMAQQGFTRDPFGYTKGLWSINPCADGWLLYHDEREISFGTSPEILMEKVRKAEEKGE